MFSATFMDLRTFAAALLSADAADAHDGRTRGRSDGMTAKEKADLDRHHGYPPRDDVDDLTSS